MGVVAGWIREGRRVRIQPVRPVMSRAGSILVLAAIPWALATILGVAALYATLRVSIPRIPAPVRVAVVIVALTPAVVAGIAGLGRGYRVGPLPGLAWMFERPSSLLLDMDELSLSVGGVEQWKVPWASIGRVEAMSDPARLAIVPRSDRRVFVVPHELLSGAVAGSTLLVDVVGLVATFAPAHTILVSNPKPKR
jgi:hypothetical protein